MDAILHGLKIDPTVLLMQIVVFILLLVIMNVLFWKPMLAHLGARSQSIAGAYKTVEDTRHEMENLRTDYLARIAQVEAEARAHIQTAIRQAQAERERLIAEARKQSEDTIAQGIAEMEREKTEALESLRSHMTDLALSAVNKALGNAADPETLRASIMEKVAQNAFRN